MGLHWLELIISDTALSLRRLRRSPGFTAAVVITLGVGIGGSTLVFSVVDAVLLEPLPYPDSERLAYIWVESDGGKRGIMAGGQAKELEEALRSIASLAHIKGSPTVTFVGDEGNADQITVQSVSPNLWKVWGVNPAIGRGFLPEDEIHLSREQMIDSTSPRPPGVVVISEEFWRSAFGGDPGILGRSLSVMGRSMTVVGVAPTGFRTLMPRGLGTPELHDLWYLSLWDQSTFGMDIGLVRPLLRLNPGVSFEQAQQRLDSFAASQRDRYEVLAKNGYSLRIAPLHGEVVRSSATFLWTLFGAVCVMLLIACGNIAGLLLARSAARRSESAIRRALGASRSRILLEALVESGIIGLMGAAAGLAAAWAGLDLVRAIAPPSLPRLDQIGLDPSVTGFAVAVGLTSALAVGMIAALRRAGIASDGREIGNRTGQRLQYGYSVLQVSLAFVLCLGGALLLESLVNFLNVDVGYQASGVMTGTMGIPQGPADSRLEIYRAIQDRISSQPQVLSVGMIDPYPLDEANDREVFISGSDGREQAVSVRLKRVTPGLLEALGLRLLAGRTFIWDDLANPTLIPIVVDAGMADRIWDGEAVGRVASVSRLDFSRPDNEVAMVRVSAIVVGVVASVRSEDLSEPDPDTVYAAYHLNPNGDPALIVRSSGDPLTTLPSVREALRAIAPGTPYSHVGTLESYRDSRTAAARFNLTLVGSFALFGLTVASLGVYALLAYTVQRRTREIGLRMAIGADRRSILVGFAAQGLRIIAVGLAIGLAAGLAVCRLLANQLYGVSPSDPMTALAVAGLLTGVALGAALVPAWRASRVEPVLALRID